MKKLITLLMALVFCYSTFGQTTVTLGTGTLTNTTTGVPTPYGTYFKNFRQQYLVLASELNGLGVPAGLISALAFEVSNVNNCSPMPNYTIKIKHTTESALTTTFDNGTYTTVWSHPNFLPVNGWNTHYFCTPFNWDGVQNVLIDICSDIIPGAFTQNASVFYTATTFNSCLRFQSDVNVACGTTSTGTTSLNRANMQITYGNIPCVPPVGTFVISLDQTIATVDWLICGSENLWQIKYGSPGFNPETEGTLITGINAKPYTITGLTPETTYQFYVRTDCGAGSYSFWTGPQSFTTFGPPLSGSYTINSALPTGGTNFNNFTAFATAINSGGLSGPVVVDVVAGSGPYAEQVMFNQLPFSSAVNTLTINGNGETLQFLSTNTNERATLKFNGSDYVIVNNLIIKALGSLTTEFGWAVWLLNNADYNSFFNCQFIVDATTTSLNFTPFVTSQSPTSATTTGLAASNLSIENCVAIGGYYGIVVNGPTAAPFSSNNTIVGNEIKDFHLYGLYVRGQLNSVFSDNLISRPTRITTGTLYMIYLTSDLSGCEVINNRVFGFSTVASTSTSYGIYGITLSAANINPLLVANNIFSGFQNMNGVQYGIYFSSTTTAGIERNIRVYHNTISLDNTTQTGASAIYPFYHTGADAILDIRNNIFSYTSNSTGAKYCMYFATASAIVTSNNNVLYRGATAGTANHTGYWAATAYTTLANWQAVPGQSFDLNSVDVDPMFISPGTGNFEPQNPAMNNIGANLLAFVPFDILGVARTAAPDPGAVEFYVPMFFPVNFSVVGTNGTLSATVNAIPITSGETVQDGNDIVFTSVPDEGYQVKEWKLNGEVIPGNTTNTYTYVDLQSAITVTVEFELMTYPVTFGVVGSNGSLEASVGGNPVTSGDLIDHGSDIIFTATPASEYRIKEWKLNGITIPDFTDPVYTVMNLITTADVTVEFEEIPIIPGDANGDGIIDVLDVTTTAAYIMGINPEPFIFASADVNGDGEINVLDIILTVNIIMSGGSKYAEVINSMPVDLILGHGLITARTDGTIRGLQFEIHGWNRHFSNLQLAVRGFDLVYTVEGETLKGIIFSMNGALIPQGTLDLLTFEGNSEQLKWGNAFAGNANAERVRVNTRDLFNNLEHLYEVSAYPNPTRDNFTASVYVPTASKINLRLIDSNGNEQMLVRDVNIDAGSHRFNANIAGTLPPGTYILQMNAEPRRIPRMQIRREIRIVIM